MHYELKITQQLTSFSNRNKHNKQNIEFEIVQIYLNVEKEEVNTIQPPFSRVSLTTSGIRAQSQS